MKQSEKYGDCSGKVVFDHPGPKGGYRTVKTDKEGRDLLDTWKHDLIKYHCAGGPEAKSYFHMKTGEKETTFGTPAEGEDLDRSNAAEYAPSDEDRFEEMKVQISKDGKLCGMAWKSSKGTNHGVHAPIEDCTEKVLPLGANGNLYGVTLYGDAATGQIHGAHFAWFEKPLPEIVPKMAPAPIESKKKEGATESVAKPDAAAAP